MALRSLALAPLLLLLGATACTSDEDDITPGTGGRIVTGGQGGALAGKGGAAQGGAGTTGQGGAGAAGSPAGGQAGQSGQGGQGGSAAGAGGMSGSSGQGGAPVGGEAGEGGAAGAPGGAGGQAGEAGAGQGGAPAGTGGTGGAAGQAGTAGAGASGAGQAGTGGVGGGCATSDTGTLLDVKLDTFNVALAGNFIPYEKERRQPIVDALAQLDSDIVCLQEVWEQSDKDLIAAAVKTKFPEVVSFKTDLETPLDDATDLGGKVPTPPTTPPCDPNDATVLGKFDSAITCLKTNCSNTTPGDENAETISSSCAQFKCASAALGLKSASLRCYGCLLPQLPTATFKEMKDTCTTNPKAGLAFNGQNGVMLLSRYPLEDAKLTVVPGTWNRRGVLSARAALPNGTKLDVYCHHTTPIFTSSLYPYTGLYGNGQTDKGGWATEQLLQAKKVVAMAQEQSCGPAVLLGDLNASHAYPAAMPPVKAEGEATLTELEKVFQAAIAVGYTPACTYCKANQNVDDTDAGADEWIDHMYLLHIDPKRVKSTERTFLTPVVDVVDSKGNMIKTELSDHYGLRTVLTLGQ